MEFQRRILKSTRGPSGRSNDLVLFDYKGLGRGPKVWIQAGTHPAEIQGIGVIHALMEALSELPEEQLSGEVTLLPLVNPLALDIKVGEHTPGPFSLATGQNYNRRFSRLACKNATDRRADHEIDVSAFAAAHAAEPRPAILKCFRKELVQALAALVAKEPSGHDPYDRHARTIHAECLGMDRVLDLHTSTRGTRFAYVPKNEAVLSEVAYLNMPYCLTMGCEFSGALDEAINQPWMLLAQALGELENHPAGLTLELGQQEHYDPDDAQREAAHIMSWLAHLGVIVREPGHPLNETWVADATDFRSVVASQGGFVSFMAKPEQRLELGHVMARQLVWDNQEGPSRLLDLRAPFDGLVLAHYPSALVFEGTVIYKLMTHPHLRTTPEKKT